MRVSVADRFGPYQIIRPISSGGMGEVYLARDTRLERDVALKVLPADVADKGDYQRRFLREARAAGALNHPNILAIYDVGTDLPCPFLITELVDGATLRHEIDRGRVAVRRLLDIAVQIAEGLAAAHDAGIVHRDLKPENIMVTRDGRAKILDFGLAKMQGGREAAAQEETEIGTVLGTLLYMSPEQGRGGVVDFRSDQFSFGVVLYEMAAGVHPFRRETGVQTLAAIIEDEPRPLADAGAATPPPLRWIVERCLAKDPTQRYAATADLARDLSTLRTRLSEADADWLMSAPRSWRRRVGQAALVTMLAAAAVWWGREALLRPAAFESLQVTPLVVDAGYQGAPAWSPDGQTLAYVAEVSGILQVFTRNLASSRTAPLTASTFSCYDPFWSTDGTRVYYHSAAEDKQGLFSVSVGGGGEPRRVLANAFRATASPDGRSLAFLKEGSVQGGRLSLWVAAADDGSGERQVPLPSDDLGMTDGWLRFSPDGSKLMVWGYGFLNTREDSPRPDFFWLVSLNDGAVRPVLGSLSDRGHDLIAFDWLPDNQRVVVSSTDQRSGRRRLWLADLQRDRIEPLTLNGVDEGYPAVSRSGRVAYTSESVNFDLIAIPTDGRPPKTILATTRSEYDPAFSRARAQYAFVSDRRGLIELSLRSADGLFDMPLVTSQTFPGEYTWTLGSLAFSPDGARIAYQRFGERTGYRIWISDTAGAGPPVPLARIPIGNTYQDAPTWSPDGNWIAYIQGSPGGTWRLVKVRARGGDQPQLVSEMVVPLSRPAWSPDGKWILFDSPEGLAIVSPDGGAPRVLSPDGWFACAWSDDSQTVFGLRESDAVRGHYMLARLDVASARERVIVPDLGAIPPAMQPIRGLSPMGGGEFATSIARPSAGIFALDGVNASRSGWDRVRSIWGRR